MIYRRIDDDFLDPLAFRPDSALGVPGLMSAYQAGNVTLANAVGTGVADDKAVYSYMPEIVKFFLGEEPILKNVPTWRCREEKHLAMCSTIIEQLVVKEVHGSGGYGMLIGPTADKATVEAFKSKLKSHPAEFHRAADARALHLPDLRRMPASRRAMSICGPSCSPEATRSASCPAASRASRSRQDRSSSIRARAAAPKIPGCWTELTCFRAPPTTSTGSRAMWSAPNISRASWKRRNASPRCRSPMSAKATNGNPRSRPPAARTRSTRCYPEANEENVTDFLAFSTDNPSSIRSCFEVARTNARAVRTALTMEMWDAINGTWLELKRYGNGPTSREELSRFLRWVQESSLRFDGSAYRTMLRNDAYWFTRLGVFMERADNTARILDVKYHMLLPAQ